MEPWRFKKEVEINEKEILAYEKSIEIRLSLCQYHLMAFMEKQLLDDWLNDNGINYFRELDNRELLLKKINFQGQIWQQVRLITNLTASLA